MVPPASHRVTRVRWYSGYTLHLQHFVYRAFTFSGSSFQTTSTMHPIRSECPQPQKQAPGLGSSHFARRYFGNRGFFLFLRVLRCFSSPRCPRTAMDSLHDNCTLLQLRSRIRISMGLRMFAPHHGFSQLATSFFGSYCQGIHLMLFLT